jgi:N-acetylglucosaminyldiphosphoundecaprenol N-acetyl-beta-D-mannosaminyltransferase
MNPSPSAQSSVTPLQKFSLFGIDIDALTMPQAVARVRQWTAAPFTKCHYVVTPNVDHTVLLQEHEGLRAAYQYADLILADGHPLVWASRLVGKPLPERVPGSDLVPQTFTAANNEQQALRVYLLGAAPGVADRAAANMAQQWPYLQTVGTYSPPLGFEKNPVECEQILERIAAAQPDLLVVGLGAPKQECWVHAHRERIQAKVALCVGATIDFLAGEKKRAPRWMQRCGVEWLHRMLSEPRRLVKRYAKDAWVFPQLVWQQWCRRSPSY